MFVKNKILPVILCGGSGSRLWPLSRASFPKQYLSLCSNLKNTFLQKTLLRLDELPSKEDPIIVCNQENRFITAEQIKQINITPKTILLEPEARNTAPAIILAALKSLQYDEDPILLILPADHEIKDNENFIKTINAAKQYALDNKLITFGIIPTSPETGYGYIKTSNPLDKNNLLPQKIEKFLEKPNKQVAEDLLKQKNNYWNSGIFMFKAKVILQEINKFEPKIINMCRESLNKGIKDLDFERVNKEYFIQCPSISIDNAVMEKTNLGVVLPLNIKWSDIGSWKSVWENSEKNKDGNVILGDSIALKTSNSLLSSNSRIMVGLGLKNIIAIETSDAVLIANKENSEDVKELVNYLLKLKKKESREHKKIYRPWGNFSSIDSGENWKVKKIEVKSGQSLSLQLHQHRSEHWIVVKGIASVEINNKKFHLNENESCFVPKISKHRLSNDQKCLLVIIEIQTGNYLEEDDIQRFDDIYGRNED